jgi:hypothetical protein
VQPPQEPAGRYDEPAVGQDGFDHDTGDIAAGEFPVDLGQRCRHAGFDWVRPVGLVLAGKDIRPAQGAVVRPVATGSGRRAWAPVRSVLVTTR